MIADLCTADYKDGELLIAQPICGEDFCDQCGDCLSCYWEDSCPGGDHRWVIYHDQAEQWRARHPEARKLGEGSDG